MAVKIAGNIKSSIVDFNIILVMNPKALIASMP